jgi:4-hydroxy-3-methylbut-2-enyl diphosphate reductase
VEVILSGVLGFCMGVRRAVELAVEESQRSADSGFPVYTFGSLIHNPKVLASLKSCGVETWQDTSDISSVKLENCSVIIRAHGISPSAEKELAGRGCRIVDATCPKVKASQLRVKELSQEGYSLFLAGDAEHAEIKSIIGYADASAFCTVVANADEAKNAADSLYKTNSGAKTALLGQTTISQDEYDNIGEAIKKYFPNLKIEKTICAATNERQKALRELLTKVDAVIIAGGRESANTRHLLAIAQESGKPCALAESSADIPENFYTYKTVGISAGASTPDSVIAEIEKRLCGG